MTSCAAPAPQLLRAVIFDVDDTLYPVADLAVRAWLASPHLVADAGLDASHLAARYARFAHLGVREGLAAAGYPPPVVEALYAIACAYLPTQLTPLAGTHALLAWLRAHGVATAVVTNGDPRRQAAKIAALGVLPLLDLVIVCDGTSIPFKPSPTPFALVLSQLGVSAQETVMVGDRPETDLAPALELGMHAARILQGGHATSPDIAGVPAFTDPDHLAPHLRHLCDAAEAATPAT